MSNPLPQDVLLALNRGNKIAAIRLLRERMGIGLAEAKSVVDGLTPSSQPTEHSLDALPAKVSAALMPGKKVIDAIKVLREATDLGVKEAKDKVDTSTHSGVALESGEVPRSWWDSVFALILAVLVAAFVGWMLFGNGSAEDRKDTVGEDTVEKAARADGGKDDCVVA